MGDPGGIGPEIILKTLFTGDTQFADCADFLIIGSLPVLKKVSAHCGISIQFAACHAIRLPDNADLLSVTAEHVSGSQPHDAARPQTLLLPIDNFPSVDCFTAKPTSSGGRASIEYILSGIDLAVTGKIDAIVTAPINKEAIKLGGYLYPGHTELLKERTGSDNVVMLMAGGGLMVAFVTSHIALKDVPATISADNVLATIVTAYDGLKRYLSIERPRIAVCGLNPHSGEAGRFGSEEADIIAPAINKAIEMGIDCTGPEPPDVVFFKARRGQFDLVIAHYHDQGAIPLKLLAFESGVNITLGIPIVRTSPDHGTAYDIAAKCIANPGSMIEAIRYAVTMAKVSAPFSL